MSGNNQKENSFKIWISLNQKDNKEDQNSKNNLIKKNNH